ncbi:LysR family transcriptional regulator [Paracoccus caeni]|uniref:LysR family transcriptional regulator n=1 Tax=Paracoccus caeni TaxID=657651 RepID=A0A934SFK5_9RHOB|nr:LysR family transcriptional regulator [Paracoccus caeni]MBK4216505.1 LysR family transcriptional regulator [Paracoccus caeni]
MDRPRLPLNALRAFEAAARHLNLTRAAVELCVTQAALSHQIRGLEERLGVTLFRRVPRGLVLTDEGVALTPVLTRAFDGMSEVLDRFSRGRFHETVNLGVVSSFATEWLMPRLADFHARHPAVDLRIHANNNRVDIAGEGLDLAIKFGDGSWHGIAAVQLIEAPMTLFSPPAWADRLRSINDLAELPLLRSYRGGEWKQWFEAQGATCPPLRGPVFDTSLAIAEMAARGHGAALLPLPLFDHWTASGRLIRPFAALVKAGAYWLTRPHSTVETPGQGAFREWLAEQAAGHALS